MPNIIKTKVNSKVTMAVVIASIAIGTSAIVATMVPPVGEGKFYGSDVSNLPPPPPLGCCDWKRGPTFETQSDCKAKTRSKGWFPLSQSSPDPAGGPIEAGAGCKIACPTDTVTCGDYCCVQGQSCTSKGGIKFCTANACPPQAPKLCDNADRSTCCASTDVCGVSTVGVWPLTGTVATCVPQNTGCQSGSPGYCGTIKKDDGTKVNVCCNPPATNCKNMSGIPVCLPSNCDPNTQDLCAGGGAQTCCPKGTCAYHPGNNTPFCNIKF